MDIGHKTSFRKIPSTDSTRQELKNNYSNVQLLAKGRFSQVYSAKNRKTGTNLVLKCIDKDSTNRIDFFREFHYAYFLSPHPSIVNSFDVAFDTHKSYVFVQELAAEGDLLKIMQNSSLTEQQSKNVVKKISSALEFLHSKEFVHNKELVHGDICLENIFVYDKNFNIVKIGDFGQTKPTETLVNKDIVNLKWAPPEICQAIETESYQIAISQDVWQLGILIFVCMTGFFPWAQADITDQRYSEWVAWQKRRNGKIPQNFKYFSPRLLKLLRRLLDPKPEMRHGVKEVTKYLDHPWVVKGSGEIEIFYDEELSVSFRKNKPQKKVLRSRSTRSATRISASNNSLSLEHSDSERIRKRSSDTQNNLLRAHLLQDHQRKETPRCIRL